MANIMIAYYSFQGHTKLVAEALAQNLGGQLVPIKPIKESPNVVKSYKVFI